MTLVEDRVRKAVALLKASAGSKVGGGGKLQAFGAHGKYTSSKGGGGSGHEDVGDQLSDTEAALAEFGTLATGPKRTPAPGGGAGAQAATGVPDHGDVTHAHPLDPSSNGLREGVPATKQLRTLQGLQPGREQVKIQAAAMVGERLAKDPEARAAIDHEMGLILSGNGADVRARTAILSGFGHALTQPSRSLAATMDEPYLYELSSEGGSIWSQANQHLSRSGLPIEDQLKVVERLAAIQSVGLRDGAQIGGWGRMLTDRMVNDFKGEPTKTTMGTDLSEEGDIVIGLRHHGVSDVAAREMAAITLGTHPGLPENGGTGSLARSVNNARTMLRSSTLMDAQQVPWGEVTNMVAEEFGVPVRELGTGPNKDAHIARMKEVMEPGSAMTIGLGHLREHLDPRGYQEVPANEFADLARADLAQGMAARLIHRWAETSGDSSPTSLAVQRAAAEVFGVADASFGSEHGNKDYVAEETAHEYAENGPLLRAFVRAQYDATQQYLTEQGIESVTLMRGMKLSEIGPPEFRHPDLIVHDRAKDPGMTLRHPDDEFITDSAGVARIRFEPASSYGQWDDRPSAHTETVAMNPLSSWTTDVGTASSFAESGGRGSVMLATRVPKARVLSISYTGVGCINEYEAVVIGNSESSVKVVHPNGVLGKEGFAWGDRSGDEGDWEPSDLLDEIYAGI